MKREQKVREGSLFVLSILTKILGFLFLFDFYKFLDFHRFLSLYSHNFYIILSKISQFSPNSHFPFKFLQISLKISQFSPNSYFSPKFSKISEFLIQTLKKSTNNSPAKYVLFPDQASSLFSRYLHKFLHLMPHSDEIFWSKRMLLAVIEGNLYLMIILRETFHRNMECQLKIEGKPWIFEWISKDQKNLPGPSMVAWISVTSASLSNTLMPSSWVCWSSCISFTILLMIWGDKFSTFEFWK